MTRFLTAFGDPTRIRIVTLLGNKGRLNVGEIAGEFEISRPAVSHHLKILRDARIVDFKKRGQEVYYWLARERVTTNFRTLADLASSFHYGD
ncbi:ArsR/SmtB family transcription factor [Paenibacillus sp. FSL F4-0125]|uniref:ArsR/SmtB family transcription factor n=1 Tax=Paenibacillus sp. FSL F4-0125 TaxID=2954730 RepID=UPI0040469CAC